MQEIATWFRTINWKQTEEDYQQTLTFFSPERACVREQVEKLSWHAKIGQQQSAINYLSKNLLPWEYIYLVFADKYSSSIHGNERKYYKHNTGKERWENAAKTIIQIGWPKVENILSPLFMWLLDPNWPGSELIYGFILTLPPNVLATKRKEIIENPQCYAEFDYRELIELIDEIYNEVKHRDTGTVLFPPQTTPSTGPN